MDVHNTVFVASVGLSLLFIITLLTLPPADAKAAINSIKGAVLSKFDILYVGSHYHASVCRCSRVFTVG